MADTNGIIFKNPTLNLWFVAPSVDLTAWNVITVSGCTEPAFNLDYTYVPSTAKWTNGIRNIWKDTLWYMSDGTTTYTAPDNGLNTPPPQIGNPAETYPDTISVSGDVNGATINGYTIPSVDGAYQYGVGPSYSSGNFWGILIDPNKWLHIYYSSYFHKWVLYYVNGGAGFGIYSVSSDNSSIPPKAGWVLGTSGKQPIPTIEYSFGGATVSPSSSTATWVSTNPTSGFVSLTDTPDEDFGYVITFDVQQGVAYPYYKYCTKTAGEVYGTLPEATRENYIFAGWYTDPDGQGTRLLATTELVAAEDATLYAKWVSYVSGKVGCGACLVSLFVLGIGTDLFCEYIGSRLAKTTPQTIIRKLPKP